MSMDPDLRITIRGDGVVRAVAWWPNLKVGGPCATFLDARDRAGVTIADVEILHEAELAEEAIVQFLCGDSTQARDRLAEWAAGVGMKRVWFPDEVRGLEPAAQGRVESRCPACRTRWIDGSEDLWGFVRAVGHFPLSCVLCGSDLPQWRPVDRPTRLPMSAPETQGRQNR